MKANKLVAMTALITTSITPIMFASPALAAVTVLDPTPAADPEGLTAANLAIAQAQCNAAAALLDTDGTSADSDIYTAEVDESDATYVSGPTEVGTEANRTIDLDTRVGAGTFTPAHREIEGNPYRNGGSVNMFGDQIAVGGHYSASAYDFTADFKTIYSHAYTCNILKAEYHGPEHHAQVGHWTVKPDFHGNEEQMTQNCAAFDSALPDGPANPKFGADQANCTYNVDTAAWDEAAYHDPATFETNVPGGSFNQDQTNTLKAHEDFGSGFDTSETLFIGQVVVCISPSKTGTKLPGAWKAQNGYSGGVMGSAATASTPGCSTAWYNGGATAGVSNLNTGSHNTVTVPVI